MLFTCELHEFLTFLEGSCKNGCTRPRAGYRLRRLARKALIDARRISKKSRSTNNDHCEARVRYGRKQTRYNSLRSVPRALKVTIVSNSNSGIGTADFFRVYRHGCKLHAAVDSGMHRNAAVYGERWLEVPVTFDGRTHTKTAAREGII